MTSSQLIKRIELLEAEVCRLREALKHWMAAARSDKLASPSRAKGTSAKQAFIRVRRQLTAAEWLAQAGTFENDPVYEEIVKRGRAYRKWLQTKARKRKS